MNDSIKRRKNEKRHSRRPEWISVRVITKASGPIEPPPPTIDEFESAKAQHDSSTITTKPAKPNKPKSRIASWLSQQFSEHGKEAPITSSWVNDKETSTMYNLSLQSHVPSEMDGTRRASSAPNSPTSPIFTRFLLKSRLPIISKRSTCSDNKNNHGMSATIELSNHTLEPSFSAAPSDLANSHDGNDNNDDNDGDDDDDYNTYETASGSTGFLGSMDDRLDEINNNSSDSVYYVDWHGNDQLEQDLDDDNYCTLKTMDPALAQVFLKWQKQSLLVIDISDEHWKEEPSITGDMIHLDMNGLSLDNAFRLYNEKVNYTKANVNTIDQVLKVFGKLYWRCNPTQLFQYAELVYIVSYSLMSLNTDIYAGQKRTTMDGFCEKTIDLIKDYHTSTNSLLFSNDGQQTMIDYLQSLYKSVKRSSLVPLNQSPVTDNITNYRPNQQHRDKPISWIQLETAFDDMFTVPRMPLTLAKSTSTPLQRRSNPFGSTKSTSWTILRRKDTYRTKIGPYKEGPLSCQLNEEEWKICWVILQKGYLHIYYHQQDKKIIINTTTRHHTLSSNSRSTENSNKNKEKKTKKRFMQHLTSSTATNGVPSSVIAIGGINNGQLLEKQTPYQEVNIHLGHTFCELVRPHVFTLQLAHNANTYLFDCGSESQATIWIRGCNFWAARETKVVILSSPSYPLSPWKRPGYPAGSSVLDKKGQQEAINTHLTHLQAELQCHIQQQQEQSGWANSTWQDKKMYLELEIRRYQCYSYSSQQQQQ